MRKHPIDGFNKMHRGTDFAAPMGTPIMASGDGVIKKAGWCGGGGNCVV
jgi:murein DD-endopeptidase MepM/ murein hydrolase activator NlpD